MLLIHVIAAALCFENRGKKSYWIKRWMCSFSSEILSKTFTWILWVSIPPTAALLGWRINDLWWLFWGTESRGRQVCSLKVIFKWVGCVLWLILVYIFRIQNYWWWVTGHNLQETKKAKIFHFSYYCLVPPNLKFLGFPFIFYLRSCVRADQCLYDQGCQVYCIFIEIWFHVKLQSCVFSQDWPTFYILTAK